MDPVYSDHSRIDERSLAMHRLVAEKVGADPNLLDKARENLRRWQKTDGRPSLTLAEWENLLIGSATQVAEFLEERSERADASGNIIQAWPTNGNVIFPIPPGAPWKLSQPAPPSRSSASTEAVSARTPVT